MQKNHNIVTYCIENVSSTSPDLFYKLFSIRAWLMLQLQLVFYIPSIAIRHPMLSKIQYCKGMHACRVYLIQSLFCFSYQIPIFVNGITVQLHYYNYTIYRWLNTSLLKSISTFKKYLFFLVEYNLFKEEKTCWRVFSLLKDALKRGSYISQGDLLVEYRYQCTILFNSFILNRT